MSVAQPLPIGFVSFFKMEASALGFAKITCINIYDNTCCYKSFLSTDVLLMTSFLHG